MNKEQEKELNKLIKQLEATAREYNLKAREYNDFSRVAYLVQDLNGTIEDLKAEWDEEQDGELGEINQDWDPGEIYNGELLLNISPVAPEAEAWFASSYC